MSGKVRTRKCSKIELRSRVFLQETKEHQTRHFYEGLKGDAEKWFVWQESKPDQEESKESQSH